MTRDEYLALLRSALLTEHGVALEIGNLYEAERARRRLYGIRDHLRLAGDDSLDCLSCVVRPGGDLWIIRRDRIPRNDLEDGLSAETRPLGKNELPDRFGYRNTSFSVSKPFRRRKK